MSAISEQEEFEFRLRAERESEQPSASTPQPPSEEFRRRSAVSLARGEHPYLSRAADSLAGLTGTLRGGIDLVGKAFGKEKASEAAFPTEAVDKKSARYITGEVLDPYAQVIGAKAFQAAKVLKPAAGMLQNAIGGGAAGLAIGALNPDSQDSVESGMLGAGIGAGFGTLAPKVFEAAAKGTGWAIDLLKGRLADIRAGKILRDVAGDELPKIQAALAASGDDVTAAQAVADVGSTKWSALGRRAEKQDSQFTSALKEGQQASREGVMSKMAGGTSSEAAAAARDKFIKMAEQELGPRRTVYLAQLATPGKELAEILPKLSSLERQYVTALQNQGRMATEAAQQGVLATGERAADSQLIRNLPGQEISGVNSVGGRMNSGNYPLAPSIVQPTGAPRGAFPVDGMPRVPPRYAPNVGPQGQFAQAADEVGVIAQGLRSEADVLRQQISELPSAFTAAPVRAAVDSMAATTVNPATDAVMSAVSKALKIAGDDPVKIAEVRKLGVNQLIGDLVQSGKVSKTDAAAALRDVRNVIDKQLGEDMVNKYFKPYSDKLANRDAMALSDELRLMVKNNPKKFVAAMRGENTDLVSKYSATADTIEEILGPKRFKLASKAADEIARDLRIKEKGKEGATELADILRKDASTFRIPAFLSWKATVGNQALGIAEESLNRKTMAKVYNAMRNGKDASAMMNQLSEFEKNMVLQSVAEGRFIPAATAATVSGSK